MTDLLDAADRLLLDRGAAVIEHPGGTLLAHLRRTPALLGSWGADPDVQAAGFCHAAYGTDGFGTTLFDLTEREVLRETIGERAEGLVHRGSPVQRQHAS